MSRSITNHRRQNNAIFACYKELCKNENYSNWQNINRTAAIFAVSNRTVRRIIKEKTSSKTVEMKKSKNVGEVLLKNYYNNLYREDISLEIYRYHSQGKHFSLNQLYLFAKNELGFEKSKTTLFRILKNMGYKYKMADRRKILCEQSHIVTMKITFLRKYLAFKKRSLQENIYFIFLDETWIFQNGSQVRQWVHDTNLKGNPSALKIKNEGKRFTVLHAGCALGFLPQCGLLLASKINDRDYHKTMNNHIFKNWVACQLIPALHQINGKCVVVMDNAPYHSVKAEKPPTSNSTKQVMQKWLTDQNIRYDTKYKKSQLWDLIKPLLADKNYVKYEIDEMLIKEGHEVLRLPPYHCQYNPIELAWSFCKNYYNKQINSQPVSPDKVANLWLEALSLCTKEMWMNFIEHCERIIEEDWKKYMGDFSVDDIPPFVINLESGSDESDNSLMSDESSVESDNNCNETVVAVPDEAESDSEIITIMIVDDE